MEPNIATVEDIIAAGEKEFDLPGVGKRGRFRKLSGPEYASTLPADPPESMDWPKDPEARREHERRWLEALSEDAIERRRLAFADSDFKILALTAIAPKLTVDAAKRLGHGAALLAAQIVEWSLPAKKAEPVEG